MSVGTALLFEERNLNLGVAFRYAWRTRRRIWLRQIAVADQHCGRSPCRVEFVDGIQNLLPANIASLTQNTFSPLLDAYKRYEAGP
ncbi:MAG: hypothetical protein M0C28_34515 [Candidatus Moduliflexus flocculans]|nr:hypothetical protein [Candidatus Moduliflexus flocculans]